MSVATKFSTALREQVKTWLQNLGRLDILIGVPCYNNQMTIGHVVSVVGEGLAKYYPDLRSGILVSDGGSLDDTREWAEWSPIPDSVERMVAIYRGMPGKGTSFRAVFEAAAIAEPKACAVVDSDLQSIAPDWVKLLTGPILEGEADYVTPYYTRHKYDGTITNNIVYPMTRALYGLRVRQPIGGDFGFSGRLGKLYASEDVWDTDVARFGIDVWMTTTAINEGFRILQTNLGAKVHDARDPAADLGPMFRQVISTLLYLMGKYESHWMAAERSRPVEIRGKTESPAEASDVTVNLAKLRDEFTEGFGQFNGLYRQFLAHENYSRLEEAARAAKRGDSSHLDSELWAKILYDVAFVYQTWSRNRRRLVDTMTPLYFGRTAAYCEEVAEMDWEGAEAVVEAQAEVFERLKGYLREKIEAWV